MFSFLLNNICVAASKPNGKKKQNWFYFVRSRLPPLNSPIKKNKTSSEFLFYVRFDSINLTLNKIYNKILYNVRTLMVLRNQHKFFANLTLFTENQYCNILLS